MAALTTIIALAAVTPAMPAAAQPSVCAGRGCKVLHRARRPFRMCRRYQRRSVRAEHGAWYVIKNDNFAGRPECLLNDHRGPNFTVVRTTISDGTALAYPMIFTGCSAGVCSRGHALPARVRSLRDAVTTWHTRQRASGIWNAAYDLWFGRRGGRGRQPPDVELMIWLQGHRLPLSSLHRIRVEGRSWYLGLWTSHHRFRHHTAYWTYIQFRLVHPRQGIAGLRLMPLIRYCEYPRWITPREYLLNVEAGFEIWSGGKGLATKSFAVRLRKKPRHRR